MKLTGYPQYAGFKYCPQHRSVIWSDHHTLTYPQLDRLMGFLRTPISAKHASEILGIPAKTILNRGAGTAKLTRIKQGRSVFLIRQEVEAHLEKLLKKKGV
jgi:hypothetical protein